jgi:beta-phosphoglucomutase family hydrolase
MTDHAVIFDMDGVLVLSGPAHYDAWTHTATAHGVELSYERFLSFNGMVNADICRLLFGDRATPAFAAAIADQKERAYRDAIAREVPLAPDCRRVLQQLQAARVPLAVGTSGPKANVDHVLDGGDIRPFFGAVVHADIVQRGKPAPDIFLRAADMLGMPPARCLVVEDAPTGIRAAHAAGMRVIGITSNHSEQELRDERAHAIVASFADLSPALVRRLLG